MQPCARYPVRLPVALRRLLGIENVSHAVHLLAKLRDELVPLNVDTVTDLHRWKLLAANHRPNRLLGAVKKRCRFLDRYKLVKSALVSVAVHSDNLDSWFHINRLL